MNAKHTSRESTPGYNLIADAAKLMQRCAGYISDQRQAEQGKWKVFYAVDVDVIKMYMAPKKISRYAKVFEDGLDTDTHELLARLIGDFIFRHLKSAANSDKQESSYLFIIPPHDEELGSMIFALSSELLDAIDKVDEPLTELFEGLSDKLANDGELSQWLIDEAPLLIELFDGKSGPRSELERFAALDEYRLFHIERYKEASSLWAFPLPLLKDKPEDFKDFTRSYEAWKERLLNHKSSYQPLYSIIKDAYVMTMIEWLNQQMQADKRRIVLITGTRGILKASSNYHPQMIEGHLKSFAELYVRHPQAFMADNDFFPEVPTHNTEVGINKFSLFDWLNLFFPKVIREGTAWVATVNIDLLKSIEESVDQNFQEAIMLLARSDNSNERADFPLSMLGEWRTQVRNACISQKISTEEGDWSERAKELLTWLKCKLDDGWTIERLRSDLASRAIQSLSALYSSTVWLGLWSKVETKRELVRGIPALRFRNDCELAQKYYHTVISAMKPNGDSDKSIQSKHLDIAEMYSQLLKDEGNNYHGHVIHALAYATKGHWHAAKTLCKIALRTVEEMPEEKRSFRKGREAAYLLAISERRLARKVGDLVVAQQYLQEAQRRKKPEEPIDLRFQSEAIAIDVAKINFEYFTNEDSQIFPKEFERIWQDASELFPQIDSEPLDECKTWIHQQLSTNVLNLALIHYLINQKLPDIIQGQVLKMLSNPKGECPCQERIAFDDMVSEFIFLIAVAVFGTENACKTDALGKLKVFQFHPSLPFDKPREKLFRQLAEQACSAR